MISKSYLIVFIWAMFGVSFNMNRFPIRNSRLSIQFNNKQRPQSFNNDHRVYQNSKIFLKSTIESVDSLLDDSDMFVSRETFANASLLHMKQSRNNHYQLHASSDYNTEAIEIMLKNIISLSKVKLEGEIVDWIEKETLAPIIALPRSMIHKYNLYHRGIGLIILNHQGKVYVHRRSSTKRLFPSMLDMFIGGVSSTGETSISTLRREAFEELGLNIQDIPVIQDRFIASKGLIDSVKRSLLQQVYDRAIQKSSDETEVYRIGSTTILTTYNHCFVDCFACLCSQNLSQSIVFRDGEVESGDWVDFRDLEHLQGTYRNQLYTRADFVPDGLQVWDYLCSVS